MYEVSTEMMDFCKENMTYNDLQRLESVLESPGPNLSVHKEFLKKLVMQIRKFFVSKDSKAKILDKEIYESNGDITKIKSIDISLKVLALLKKSKDPEIKKNAEMLQNLYTQIKTHKNGFLKVKAKIKTGNMYESAMAEILYSSYVLQVQCFIAGVSLTLAKVHDLGSKNPYKDYSMLRNAERTYNLYRDGTMKKALTALTEKQAHTSEAIEIAALAVIGVVIAFVTLCLSIRILVYYFYYTRMQLADYFEEQAQFLNLHKSEVKRNDNLAARDKDGIISAQKAWADRFMTLAEWIQDDDIAAAKKATSEIKKVNKEVIPTNQIDVPNTGMEFF